MDPMTPPPTEPGMTVEEALAALRRMFKHAWGACSENTYDAARAAMPVVEDAVAVGDEYYESLQWNRQEVRDLRARVRELEHGRAGAAGRAAQSAETSAPACDRAENSPGPSISPVEAVERYLLDNGHPRECEAVKGPGDETWLKEEDCNCGLVAARAALPDLKRMAESVNAGLSLHATIDALRARVAELETRHDKDEAAVAELEGLYHEARALLREAGEAGRYYLEARTAESRENLRATLARIREQVPEKEGSDDA